MIEWEFALLKEQMLGDHGLRSALTPFVDCNLLKLAKERQE
jgi:hypothetical protein